MDKKPIDVDSEGRIRLTPELREKYGIKPNSKIFVEEGRNTILIHSPATRLARIYVEPTNQCNLGCATCIRHVWEEPLGNMTERIYQKILDALTEYSPVPEIFFGGFGEPLSHPNIVSMIQQAHDRGARVELITNGTLLEEETLKRLIKAGIDQIWVSIDGATPESYADVRLGNQLPRILENLRILQRMKHRYSLVKPDLGISFVAMKRNAKELPDIIELASNLGASQLMVSNVMPYSPDLKDEILYYRGMTSWRYRSNRILFPRMDISDETWPGFRKLLERFDLQEIAGNEFAKPWDTCPFVDRGSMSVRYDGKISPCLPLMHDHTNYLEDRLRTVHEQFFGNLGDQSLLSIWHNEEYKQFRERVKEYDFSPCTVCNTCEYADSNQEDCIGSVPISCGGCLWGQGFIQCP